MKKVRIVEPGRERSSYVLGPDLDLDQEVVLLPNGQRLTNALVEKIVDEMSGLQPGRPSLTAPGTRSPEVKARVPQATKDLLEATAAKRGTTTSVIIREALEAFLKSA